MNVTRDVVIDLLPVYLAGEASADTRALVEAFLATDPPLARLAREGFGEAGPLPVVADAPARAALSRTRRLLHRRQLAFGVALALTLLPLSFGFVDDRIVWAMWRDAPATAALCLIGAAACWTWFARVRAALRAPGF
ncbi:MAG: hypothetical protein U0P30_06950 [Vicinamibacterales bacterium]